MRNALAILLGLCLLGLLGIVGLAAGSDRTQAFTLGVTSAGPVVKLDPGSRVCQGPIAVPDGAADFDRVVFVAGTYHRPGSELTLTLEPVTGGKPFARGRLAAGYGDLTTTPTHAVPVGHVTTRKPFRACLLNTGTSAVAIYGNADAASRTSTATLNGDAATVDLDLSFDRAESRSALSLVGAMFDRAALWRASWVGAWLYILLALVVVAGVPALVAMALRDATRG